jgi:branched-chain amino acid aminotransferase
MRYALSVFEGVRLYKQADGSGVRPFRLEEHLARMRNSLRLMWLPEPGGVSVAAVVAELVRRNEIEDDSYVRISVNPLNCGDIASAARVGLTVTVSRMGRKRWLATGQTMRVAVSCWQRSHELAFPSAAKNISNYAGPRIALLEAIESGFDGVILTNGEGFVCESPTAALFVVRGGTVLTPALSDGVLPSITRAAVLEVCDDLGIPAREQRLSRTDVYLADEAFLCGTGVEFAPIGSAGGRPLPGRAGRPLTSRIVEAYFRLVRGEAIGDAAVEEAQ